MYLETVLLNNPQPLIQQLPEDQDIDVNISRILQCPQRFTTASAWAAYHHLNAS